MFCNPQLIDGVLICHKCGNDFPISLDEFAAMDNDPTRIVRPCRGVKIETRGEPVAAVVVPPRPATPPPFPRKFANYIYSTVKHIAHGCPRCSQEDIDKRLEICNNCPSNQFLRRNPDGSDGMCAVCGCCGTNQSTFNNKLARADESCPHGHWGAIEKTSKDFDNRA